jgi:hypothetical protein
MSPVSQTTPIALTAEQQVAVTALMNFLSDPNPPSLFFALAGFAGTGKTFCMREVAARCAGSHSKFAYTAPTNKAAKVLRGVTGDACTIYSLLGLRIDKSGELKKLVGGHSTEDFAEYDAVFLDEGSMVGTQLFDLLLAKAEQHGVKVVFLGDKAQLPPVGEASSRVWTEVTAGASLSTVMRHDNQILALATKVREAAEQPFPSIILESDHSEDGSGVWKLSRAAFKKAMYEAAMAGEFADGTSNKVLAWRNVQVGEYNNLIRSGIFGAAAVPGLYLPGDRIVATAPCMAGDMPLLATDEEAIVEGVATCKHPLYPGYAAQELTCRSEENKVIRLLVLHPSSQQQFNEDAEKKAANARTSPKLWQAFWKHQELFHAVKYAYALTVHRAQGSTYETVWVDYQDILKNRNRREAFQCLYVACSRPTTKLLLA